LLILDKKPLLSTSILQHFYAFFRNKI